MQIYLRSWYNQLKGTLAMVWYLVEKDRLTLGAQKLMTLNIFLSAHGLILILKNAWLSSGSAAHLKLNLARTNVFITTRLCFYVNNDGFYCWQDWLRIFLPDKLSVSCFLVELVRLLWGEDTLCTFASGFWQKVTAISVKYISPGSR